MTLTLRHARLLRQIGQAYSLAESGFHFSTAKRALVIDWLCFACCWVKPSCCRRASFRGEDDNGFAWRRLGVDYRSA